MGVPPQEDPVLITHTNAEVVVSVPINITKADRTHTDAGPLHTGPLLRPNHPQPSRPLRVLGDARWGLRRQLGGLRRVQESRQQ